MVLLCVAGISVSSLSDNLFVLHVKCEDNKQKVQSLVLLYSRNCYKPCLSTYKTAIPTAMFTAKRNLKLFSSFIATT